jgi:hypothetical protein
LFGFLVSDLSDLFLSPQVVFTARNGRDTTFFSIVFLHSKKSPSKMPLWRIFSHPDTFSLEQRAAIARDVTALYGLLPAFYVNVIFINSSENDIWIGGKPKTNFVRIVIEQIARTLPDGTTEDGKARRKGWMDRVNEVCPILTLFRKRCS